MEEKDKYREYKTDDIIVYWNRPICSHAGKCWAIAPLAFRPNKRPWVSLEETDPLLVIKAIDACPTGALKYDLPKGSKVDPEAAKGPGWVDYKVSSPPQVQIRTVREGPFLVKGSVRLLDIDGTILRESDSLVLCRCGKTKNPPFCDGEHIHHD